MSRNASAEEITAAYKKLSRLYHPDKHIDEKRKQQALLMFSKLKNAYEGNDTFSRLYASGTMLFSLGPMNIYCLLITIFCPLVLNDPHKRAIYDCLGKEGLQEQGWEIVQRTRTPQEIREEYDRLAR